MSTWQRMHLGTRSVSKEKMNQTSGSLSSRALNCADLNKPRTEISIQKRSSSACKIACSRLYENAIKHQEYINAKMKENGIKQIDFVNRSSREIVSKMQDKRKPLYHLIERKDQQLEDIQYFLQKEQRARSLKQIPKEFTHFIERNYNAHLLKKAEESERQKNISATLYSETGFIPIIDKQSKTMTEIRENNEPGEIYKNLFKDAAFLNEKKQSMRDERNKKSIQDELKEATFCPQMQTKRAFVPKYVNPKSYLKSTNDTENYLEQFKRYKIISSKSTNILPNKLFSHMISTKCLTKGSFNYSAVSLSANIKKNLNGDFKKLNRFERTAYSKEENLEHESLPDINILEMSDSDDMDSSMKIYSYNSNNSKEHKQITSKNSKENNNKIDSKIKFNKNSSLEISSKGGTQEFQTVPNEFSGFFNSLHQIKSNSKANDESDILIQNASIVEKENAHIYLSDGFVPNQMNISINTKEEQSLSLIEEERLSKGNAKQFENENKDTTNSIELDLRPLIVKDLDNLEKDFYNFISNTYS